MKRLTAEDIRQEYPNPKTADRAEKTRDEYCVGGAFIHYLRDHDLITDRQWEMVYSHSFPYQYALADLMASISDIDRHEAERIAEEITTRNDNGDFEAAWEYLDDFLYVFPQFVSCDCVIENAPDLVEEQTVRV